MDKNFCEFVTHKGGKGKLNINNIKGICISKVPAKAWSSMWRRR
jgi:hypothetical protein